MSAQLDPQSLAVAQEWQKIVDDIKAAAPEFFAGKRGDVEFRVTAKGRPILAYCGLVLFRDPYTGEPRAARARGGRAEVGAFTDDGLVWAMRPPSDPGSN